MAYKHCELFIRRDFVPLIIFFFHPLRLCVGFANHIKKSIYWILKLSVKPHNSTLPVS